MWGYVVIYLAENGKQVFAGRFRYFYVAQAHRDDLRAQGFEAWIEDE